MEKNNPRKKILSSNLFWMFVALLSSLAIWTYVIGTETSTVTQTFRGVRVDIIGDELLQNSKNLIITDVDTNSVRVELRGPRRIVDALDSSDLVAQVDVSKLSRAAYASMKYKIVYPDGTDTRNITEVSYSPDTVNFMVSNLTKISVPVRGGYEGKLAPGFTAEAPVFEPANITVIGPEAYLKDISHAWVSFGTNITADSTYSVEAAFTLMNSDGEPVHTEYLTTEDITVTATLPILEMKDVPLSVDLIEGAGATTANTKVTITPDHISLAGDSAILDALNRIVLGTINLNDFKSSFSETYSIPFDNNLRNLTGVTEAKVDIEIVGLSTATFNVKNLSVVNAPANTDVEIVSASVDVVLRGTEEQLASLNAESIRAVADLSDYRDAIGTYMPTVKIYVDGYVDVGAIGTYSITVRLGS
ncbi:MAG: hypothetical protein K6C08_05000 [Oscillospiraceae bacterium]|nr:hypothetical protein [Oscillospiraceae bacterium]